MFFAAFIAKYFVGVAFAYTSNCGRFVIFDSKSE